MPRPQTPDVVHGLFALFREAFAQGDYTEATELFERALNADPGAFRYFVAYASGPLAEALSYSERRPEIIQKLDALIADEPYVHYLGNPNDPMSLQRIIKLREANLDKGLPSVLLVTQGKSASVSVASIFNSGFRLPSICYSLVNLDVIESWAHDYARGGACYTTHLIPWPENITRLKRAGIKKMIVHVRDPRQALVSMLHHFDMYPDQMAEDRSQAAAGHSMSEQARNVLRVYENAIGWISEWVDAEPEIEILFSTHEQFVTGRAHFIERYLEFYSADRQHFSYEDAVRQNEGTDYHFRSGRTDEWRQVLDPDLADQLSAMLPGELKSKFGWPD